jgi:hypothetical protein
MSPKAAVERDTCELLCLDLPKAECVRATLPAPDELERRERGEGARRPDAPRGSARARARRDRMRV